MSECPCLFQTTSHYNIFNIHLLEIYELECNRVAVVAALLLRRRRRRCSCVLVSDFDPWPLPASVVAALWGLCCLLSLASVPTKLLRFPTIMSSAHGSRMLPISFTELGMHRQRRRQQQLRRHCFSRPDLIKIRRCSVPVYLFLCSVFLFVVQNPQVLCPAFLFLCSVFLVVVAGSLSGISFPTICVVVVLAVISVYVVDNWMMIVSSLLISNARRTGTIVFRL